MLFQKNGINKYKGEKMNNTTYNSSIKEIVTLIETLPIVQLQKVHEFVIQLKDTTEIKKRTWHSPDSLMNSQPLQLGERDWTRDDLYEERMKKYE